MLVVGKNNEMKKLQAPLVHSKNLKKQIINQNYPEEAIEYVFENHDWARKNESKLTRDIKNKD